MKHAILLLFLTSCASLGVTNEDAGHSVLASDVSVPANGRVVYTVDRQPRTTAEARQYNRDMGVSRSMLSWFGFNKSKGTVRTGGANGS